MRQDRPADLEGRVARAAEAVLARQRYVSALDVLLAIGWLAPSHLAEWRQGRIECIEQALQAKPTRVAQAMRTLREWAQRQGLAPSEIAYTARTRDRRPLRFSPSGDPEVERAHRTHWISPELTGQAREGEEHPLRRRRPVEPRPQALRAAGPPGRTGRDRGGGAPGGRRGAGGHSPSSSQSAYCGGLSPTRFVTFG